jgi:tetratricopeptide (TPR) repeat protein
MTMKCCRKVPIILICLAVLAPPAWAGQNLLIKGIEAQKAGNNKQAVELLSKYLKQYPQMAGARRPLALALAGLGRKREALEVIDFGLTKDPKDIQLLLTKANLLTDLDRRPEAIEVLTQALKCDPKNAEVLKELGLQQAGPGVVLPGRIPQGRRGFFHRHPPGPGCPPRLFLPGQHVPLSPGGDG